MSLRGIGIDLVTIDRVAVLLARHQARFLERCFRAAELAPAAGEHPRADLAARVACCWAVKEACLKALGGDVRSIPYRDVEVEIRTNGAPVVRLHGRAAIALAARGGRRILASLSRERALSIGFVIIEG